MEDAIFRPLIWTLLTFIIEAAFVRMLQNWSTGSKIGAEDAKNGHKLKDHYTKDHLSKMQLVGPNGRRLINYGFLYHISHFFSFAFEFWSQKRMSENGGGSGYFKNYKFFGILIVSSGIIENH